MLNNGTPWESGAGIVKGLVSNVNRLSYNPNAGQEGRLYKVGGNPVILSGGSYYFNGDKTTFPEPSSFSRENVRQTMNYIKYAIFRFSKPYLFKNNTESVRREYFNETNAFLQSLKSRNGITDFKVLVEELNTGIVIDNNEFRARFLIKPVKSINFIILEFTAVGTDMNFDEV
jgi:hypothetical protein